MQYVDGELYWMSRDRRTVHIFDLKSKEFCLLFKYQEEGPDGLGSPLGFYVVNQDSLYFPVQHRLSLVNHRAELLRTYDFSSTQLIGPMSSRTRYSHQFTRLRDGILIGLNSGLVSKNLLNKSFLDSYYPFVIFDSVNEEIKDFPFRFDQKLFDNGANLIGCSYSGDKDDLYVITQYSDLIHHYNASTEETKIITLASSLVNNFSDTYFKSDPRNNSASENVRMIYRNSSNLGLLYDSHRGLIYRMGWKGEEIGKNFNFMKFSEFLPHFVVGVYDAETFELLAEFDLPRNKYLAHHYFVSEDGLNLFLNHPDDPEAKEDEINIEVFDFSKLKH
ncbi:DUF4221 domain-containing protein [Belliella kenyensis]|nr:DUF4221 domain-containing protein [Belliella kenyensis]